jgi:hypothetical protein
MFFEKLIFEIKLTEYIEKLDDSDAEYLNNFFDVAEIKKCEDEAREKKSDIAKYIACDSFGILVTVLGTVFFGFVNYDLVFFALSVFSLGFMVSSLLTDIDLLRQEMRVRRNVKKSDNIKKS